MDFERFRPILEKTAGRPLDAGRGFEIQDTGSAEPSPAVAGHDGDYGRDRLTWLQLFGLSWSDASAKASQKDTEARWTVKYKEAKAKPDVRKPVDIAIPVYG